MMLIPQNLVQVKKKIDKSATVTECEDEKSFSRDIGTSTVPNEALPTVRENPHLGYVYLNKDIIA